VHCKQASGSAEPKHPRDIIYPRFIIVNTTYKGDNDDDDDDDDDDNNNNNKISYYS